MKLFQRFKIKKLLMAAHYITAYLAREGDLINGLIKKGAMISVETSRDEDGKFCTLVSLNETGEVVFLAEYTETQLGHHMHPDYRVHDIDLKIYEPGGWEQYLYKMEELAYDEKERRAREIHMRYHY